MYASDFEYDGHYLSDFGFVVCDFDGASSYDVISAGSKITFNKVSRNSGKKYGLNGTSYDECITATFDICKDPCFDEDGTITSDEYRDLMRWLNRGRFLKFRMLNELDDSEDEFDRETCYFYASFNIEKIKMYDKLYGLRLTLETNAPFGFALPLSYTLSFDGSDEESTLFDMSDEIGYTHPNMTINVMGDGDLTIYNDMTDCTFYISDCTDGEVITVNGETMVIETTSQDHDLGECFNFEFLSIGNTVDNRENHITASIPCEIEITYSPIIKETP